MKNFLFVVALIMATSMGINAQSAKYQGEFDLSYSIGTGTFSTGRLNIHTIHGAKIGNHFSIGVGVGLDYYHEFYEKGELIVPIFLNTKGYLPIGEKTSPYLSMDFGYGIGATDGVSGLGGLVWSPAIGIKHNKVKFQLGYTSQELSEYGIGLKMNAIQFMFGIVF